MDKKLEQLKIFPEDHEWVLDEQTRLRKSEGKEPTQAQLFHRIRLAYEKTTVAPVSQMVYADPIHETSGRLTGEESRRIAQLLSVLRGGQSDAIEGVQANLDVFHNYTKVMQADSDAEETAAEGGAGQAEQGSAQGSSPNAGDKRPSRRSRRRAAKG